MSWINGAKTAARKFEGSVSHMYLDTVGKVTVGVGELLPNKSAATRLGFVKRTGGKASKKEIEDDHASVLKCSKGKKASYYKRLTKLDLPNSVIDTLLTKSIKEAAKGCARVYPSFSKLPDPVKEALVDIAFNTGSGGLKKFKKMKAAIDVGDFQTAAKESKRPQVSGTRNSYVHGLFMKAAAAAKSP